MTKPKIRCAIYTRKSTDEGLDQEFNSLDAQYEACAAYVTSQRHEGWTLVSKRYDDGGVSGGTLERPALQALLADIEAGHVNRIIVYKIDRLTRSLSDFSKIVDRLDALDASFVSVTQSFNTATSMGRLTLNMLLSFAQFEREVTAERIRDKIAASKAKGLWMGGTVPLGYDPHPDKTIRGLLINRPEATTVQQIFRLYADLGCLRRVERAAEQQTLRSKSRHGQPGAVFTRGAIHKLLTNPIYLGKIRHKDKIYDGQHEAIIDQALWEQVQAALQSKRAKRRGAHSTQNPTAPLKGKLFDPTGDLLKPTHTKKAGRVVRYYISNRLIKAKDPSGMRLPAKTIEPFITQAIQKHVQTHLDQGQLLTNSSIPAIQDAQAKWATWRDAQVNDIGRAITDDALTPLLLSLLKNARIHPQTITITLDRVLLAAALGQSEDDLSDVAIEFNQPFKIKKRGVEAKMICGDLRPEPDQTLQKALAAAHAWVDDIKAGHSIAQIAKDYAASESLIRKRLKLAFLSPVIQKAILCGTQPADLTLAKLMRTKIDLDWDIQAKQLGISETF